MSSGSIVQVIGAVVDVEFTREAMPKVYDALTVDNTEITLEVQQQLGDGVVRTIALGSTDGLKRGLPVTGTGAAISVPVGEKTLGRVMDVLGRPIDEAGPIGAEKSMLDTLFDRCLENSAIFLPKYFAKILVYFLCCFGWYNILKKRTFPCILIYCTYRVYIPYSLV